MKEDLKDIKKLLKTILLFIGLFSFSSIIASIFKIDKNTLSSTDLILFQFGCSITFLLIIISCYYKTLKNDFKKYFSDFGNNIEISFKYWITGFIIMVIANFIIINLTNSGLASNEESVRALIDKSPIYMLFSVIIYAPLTEELIFRKGIRDVIKNKYIFIALSGILFGSLHVLTSVEVFSDFLHLIPYCSLGICFAIAYTKTDNIFTTIMMHSFHNGLAIILYLIGSGI